MFITLLAVTFGIAALTAFVAARAFDRPIERILGRLVAEDLGGAWQRYIKFAIYVVGISGGVRLHALEQYILPRHEQAPYVLNADRWVLEVYRTVIASLQSIAWMLLIFFAFALVAYVVVRGQELKAARQG
jgi:hypothetical protein